MSKYEKKNMVKGVLDFHLGLLFSPEIKGPEEKVWRAIPGTKNRHTTHSNLFLSKSRESHM